MNWQPIETAPRECFDALVWAEDRAVVARQIVRPLGYGDYWEVPETGEEVLPTHWMPLPEEPK